MSRAVRHDDIGLGPHHISIHGSGGVGGVLFIDSCGHACYRITQHCCRCDRKPPCVVCGAVLIVSCNTEPSKGEAR
jgi:hypothetical protein